MEIGKYIAALLASLMAVSTYVGAALAANNLSGFPGFLYTVTATASSPAYLVVVGANAKTSDVVGAIDLASRLAEGSFTIEKVTGAAVAAVEGKEVSVALGSALTTEFGTDALTQTQIPFLRRETISYEDQSSWLVEEITVPNAQVKHDSELNGTVYIDLSAATTPLQYKVKFTTPIKLAGTYDKLLKVNLFGQEFSIVNVTGDDKIKILTGVSGTINEKTGLTYGEYTIYADIGAADGSWVRVNIMKGDNKVDTLYVNRGSTATSSVTGLDVTLTGAWVSSDNVVLRADVVVGPKGKTLKEYGDDSVFPLNDYWTFDIEASETDQTVTYIALKYNVNETNRYLKAGEKAIVPNNYFELGFDGLAIKDYVKLTITPGRTTGGIYDISNPDTKLTGELPAIVITADKPVFNGESSSKAYIAYNATNYFRLAYYDESLGKIVSGTGGAWVNSTIGDGITFSGKYDKHIFSVSYKNESMPAYLTIDTQDTPLIKSLFTYASDTKKFILGNKEGEAEGVDVIVDTTEKGTQEWKETLDWGTEIEGIKSNSASNKVVIDIPADQQKAKVYVGKLGAVAPGEVTYNKVSPIKTAVAKLDSEVTAADKAAYHLVLVGGPCVNSLVADLKTAGKFDYGCADWPAENFAYFQVIDDAFTSGKVAVVLAGTRAEDTRLACSVAQNYDAYKTQFGNATKVKITGTIAAPSITPA